MRGNGRRQDLLQLLNRYALGGIGRKSQGCHERQQDQSPHRTTPTD
jgi:hypothetical protein